MSRRVTVGLQSILASFLSGVILVLLSACEGSGSDVGPRLEPADRRVLVGTVTDRRGEALRGVRVEIGTASGSTDATGRFHVIGPPRGKALLTLDGQIATAPDGRYGFAALNLEFDFGGGRDELDRSVVLPAQIESAEATLPLGQVLALGTVLVDPRTGARLDLSGAILQWSAATPAPSTVELCFSVLDADEVVLAPDSSEILQNGSAALIGPAGVAIEGARIELPDELSFAAATEPLRTFNLRGVDGIYEELNAASTAAGSVVLMPPRCETGLLMAVRALNAAQTTSIVGQLFDSEDAPLGDATLSVGPFSGRPKSNGKFTLEEIPAVDGHGTPLALELCIDAAQGWRGATTRVPFVAEPGQTIDLIDLELDTTRVVDFRGLVVQRGLADDDRRVTIGNESSGRRSARSDDQGKVSVFDLLTARRTGFNAHLRERLNENKTFADGRNFSTGSSSGFRESRLFLDETRLLRTRLQGSAQFLVFVRGTVAPVEDAVCMVGLDGSKKSRRRVSTSEGGASFNNAGEGYGIYTAGLQTNVVARDGIHDQIVLISYHSYFGVDSRRGQMQIATAVDEGPRPRGDTYAGVLAQLIGLTDPLAVPPANGSYFVNARTQRRANRGEVASERFELGVDAPVSDASLPRLDDQADFADPEATLALPIEPSYAFAIERDADLAGKGPITKVGLVGPLDVEGGALVTRAMPMQAAVPIPRTLILNDLDPALAGTTPVAEFGWQLSADDAVLVGVVDDAVWDGLARRLDLAPPRSPSPFDAEAFAHVHFVATNATESVEQQAVVPAGSGTLGFDLVQVPRLLSPPPQGVLDPQLGMIFVADPRADWMEVAVRREETIVVDGESFLVRYEWIVDVVPGTQEIVFPVLPTGNLGGNPVPQFFEPGTYEIVITAWRSESLDFSDRAAYRDIIDPADGVPLAASRYRTSVVVN